MIALFRSSLFLLLAVLITAPAGLLVTLSVVLPMRYRFAIIAAWRTDWRWSTNLKRNTLDLVP